VTGPTSAGVAPAFSVLVVCTGNVCRSPAAELLLRAGLGPDSGVDVRSAGTRALVGRPVEPSMARLLTAAGAQPAEFAARQLTAADVASADLVLTAERAHRSAVVALHPRALRRTFTLLEFAELAVLASSGAGSDMPGPDASARLAWLVDIAPTLRPGRSPGAVDDVQDPFGRDEACFAAAAEQVGSAVAGLVAIVRDAAAPLPGVGGPFEAR
jgi:protein-tyrosine phosphatase